MNPKLFFILLFFFGWVCACRSVRTDEVVVGNYDIADEEGSYYSGLIAPSASDYLKIERVKMVRSFKGEDGELFRTLPVRMDLSEQLPRAGNQGRQNSCTGWALSFAVKSFQENREFGWGLSGEHLFSPSFLYNQINGGRDDGVDLIDAMKFMMEHGTVPLTRMPYMEKDVRAQPDEETKNLGRGFRALGYRRIDERDLNHLKAYLATGEPVVLVVEMFRNFLSTGMRKTEGIYKDKAGRSLGYHAVVAVGYDDGEKTVKILNSWGERWGKNGYGWIAYDFYPEVVKQAFVVYDTPTPHQVALELGLKASARLPAVQVPVPRDAKPKTQTVWEHENRVLIVPDESGITYGGGWLRLATPLGDTGVFFGGFSADENPLHKSIFIEDDVLKNETVSRMRFLPGGPVTVMTHQGVGFGSTREDVHRIYSTPDFVSDGEDTYFFHAVAEDWGGIQIQKNASLVFAYDGEGRVNRMVFENVFKEVRMGTALKEVSATEGQKGENGTHFRSDDGAITFFLPKEFSDIKKSNWPGTGYGYFIKNPEDIYEYVSVKVFVTDADVDDDVLKRRMDADLKVHGQDDLTGVDLTFSGMGWKKVVQSDEHHCYYGYRGKRIFQLDLASSKKLDDLFWARGFLDSVKVSHDNPD